jgi:hypothetical protein
MSLMHGDDRTKFDEKCINDEQLKLFYTLSWELGKKLSMPK